MNRRKYSLFGSVDLDQPRLVFEFWMLAMPSFQSSRFTLKGGDPFADGHGCANQVINLQGTSDLDQIDRVQSDASNAAALATIGSTAENAWLDTRFEIRRVIYGHPRKKAFPWITRRLPKGTDDPFIYEKPWIPTGKAGKLSY